MLERAIKEVASSIYTPLDRAQALALAPILATINANVNSALWQHNSQRNPGLTPSQP